MNEVEKLMFENKLMKLELQRIKPGSSGSGGSNGIILESDVFSTDNTSKQLRMSFEQPQRRMMISP